ncbi:MAG: hypothetical protein R2873_24720 [Caldilineaceae bacterium]
MQTYVLRRTLQAIPLLIILSIMLFLLVRIAPGGPLAQAERNPNISQEQIERLRVRLGLDQPLAVQYVKVMRAVVFEGDLGVDQSGRPWAR